MPFGRDGALQDTIEEVSPLVTTLISTGALGTKNGVDIINCYRKYFQCGGRLFKNQNYK